MQKLTAIIRLHKCACPLIISDVAVSRFKYTIEHGGQLQREENIAQQWHTGHLSKIMRREENCQEANINIKGAAGIIGKYRLCSTYDNNLSQFQIPVSVGKKNLWASIGKLKMKRNVIFQNDPKHDVSTKEWLYQRSSQSPDINLTEHLWGDLKSTVHQRCHCNLSDWQWFHKEEWANIAISRCAMPIDSYTKRLSA